MLRKRRRQQAQKAALPLFVLAGILILFAAAIFLAWGDANLREVSVAQTEAPSEVGLKVDSKAADKSKPEEVRVSFVVDGDTFVLEDGRKVRLIGIDTPEYGQDYFQEAKQKTFDLVFGKKVLLEKDTSEYDTYGRILRYVYVDGVFVNLELVKGGYARALTIPPDVKYADLFTSAEYGARLGKRGIWKDK